jgi:hypothetical protein
VLAARLVERFYAAAADAPIGSPELSRNASVYQGHYLQTRRRYDGLQGFLFRLVTARVKVTPDGWLTFGLFGQSQRLVPTDQVDVFRSVDGDGPLGTASGGVVFRRERDRAVRMEVPELALERVGRLFEPPTLLLFAGLGLVASFAVIVTAFVRRGRALPRTRPQHIAGCLQTSTALAWLTSAGALGVFAATARAANLLYSWPPRSILVFSAASLLASLLAATTLLLLPRVWRGAPNGVGWAWWRKLRFTVATLVFVTLGSLLGLWGALQPWNS